MCILQQYLVVRILDRVTGTLHKVAAGTPIELTAWTILTRIAVREL
jgi:hypothetical protein